ncbi:30S ribosomal protein S13 [Candidatus Shapirobacteria bacterium CG10_big_fil_rev_8_21_14_0_10_38_14]|uniref:Small ribosomal subunit protein uS13 n=1 Tax=Candidatus Shapirobacteria bacterium CG10_big_fil_rev_8_21_14_0_10_38_14 TaxID=1974483 RepID=A0A2M8L5R7_9BACT|nr:MAG: 30S ribosomal protein S13 [Candidatus Shapirobacteria bacterium CG10_big_fil_rev_8_21_14_0_10_38_14]
MARIAGVDLPDEKRTDIGLTTIFGIGRSNVVAILEQAKVDPAKRIKSLTGEEINRLQEVVDKVLTEGALRQKIAENIKRLKTIGSYRGIRHSQNLPVRGQRTRSNARTKRGKRQTVGSLKKEETIKSKGPEDKEKKDE